MLHHVSVGVPDVREASRFYDAILGALGYRRIMEFLPHAVAYGETAPVFWVQVPHDGRAPSAGNGVHIGFAAASQLAVRAFHEAALKAGAKDEGAPGPRPNYGPNYYGTFVRDPYGNKLEAVFLAMSPPKGPARSATKPKRKPKLASKPKGAGKKPLAQRSPARRPGRRPARKR